MFQTKSGRPISYYGQIFQEEVVAIKKNKSVKTLDDFFAILLECWCKETAYPSCQIDYDYSNDPTYGQCAITATLFYDIFGGTIHKIKVNGGGTHYFNKLMASITILQEINSIYTTFLSSTSQIRR